MIRERSVADLQNSTKVKLQSALDYGSGYKIVLFDVSPSVSETGAVTYQPLDPIHAPGQMLAYKNTASRNFRVDAKFVSRNPKEARKNIERLNVLRGWRMPYFGAESTSITDVKDTANPNSNTATIGQNLANMQATLRQRMGLPPEILYLSAYASGIIGSNSKRGNIANVPVAMVNLSIEYPPDVNYILTESRGANDPLGGVSFPVIMSVGIDLQETHSPYEYSTFNLPRYYAGILEYF